MTWSLKVIAAFLMSAALYGCESVPQGMVRVPAGEFTMGSSEEDKSNHALSLGLPKPWYADEAPERRVNTKSYYIDKYEVANRQYYIFCQATDHKPPRTWGGPRYPDGQGDYPVTHINFYDAAAYSQWVGKRLPTEAEWEKAARGVYGALFPWGNQFDPKAANISLSNKRKSNPRPVGSFPRGVSPYGVHDMIGNVWEWVWDYYLPYPGSDYRHPDFGEKYVIVRGLSHMGVAHFPRDEYGKVVALMARASYREKLHPFARKDDVGFRCVKDRRTLYERWFADKKES